MIASGASRGGQLPELVVKYVRAYAKTPSDGAPDDHSVKCLSPVFGIPSDAVVEIVVGTLDGTQAVVRGQLKYTFFGACSVLLRGFASVASGQC